jgi:hypothetical protein
MITWTATPAQAPNLPELWECAGQRGWMSFAGMRVVIQFRPSPSSRVLLDTVGSLARYLADNGARVELFAAAGHSGDLNGLHVRALNTADTVSVENIAGTGSLAVPRFWFESFRLITVAEAYPSSSSRIAGTLDVQADALIHLGNRGGREALVCEARRLATSDLAIACGYADRNSSSSQRWWVVGPDAVAVDQRVARAAGLDPAALPNVRALARHVLLPSSTDETATLPRLAGCAGPAWRAHVSRLQSAVTSRWHVVHEDCVTSYRNLHKIPKLVRRLAKRRAS